MRAQDPSVSFTELLLGDEESGFALDHQVLSESYVPQDPISMPMGGLGAAAGASFERERERESLHLSSHTGLMQVLPGHPLADTITECSITA